MASNLPPKLRINPPLVNSANPWATTLQDLQALYESRHTGGVTTRTSLHQGFAHDPSTHQFTLFDTTTHKSEQDRAKLSGHENASLNTLGYSPIPLESYLDFIRTIASSTSNIQPGKGFIVSVTGSPGEVLQCYKQIAKAQAQVPFPLAMEINLSCPNIPGKPPPAYNRTSLSLYLMELQEAVSASGSDLPRIPYGLKTPPYTHSTEYHELISALETSAASAPGRVCPVSFITATNTLGSCLVLADPEPTSSSVYSSSGGDRPALFGAGIGGMAGAPLHPLALGNVRTIRRMLDEREAALGHIQIIGVGGVLDTAGFKRMKAVGADFVGVGTALGIQGVDIFAAISKGL